MNLYWDNKKDIENLQSILDDNKAVLISSDTVLGLTTRLTQQGYDQLNRIKHRFEKPYLILIGSIESVDYFTDQILSDKVQKLINSCWPGPVTLIFKAREDLPDFMKSSNGTVALRFPDHQGLQELLLSYQGLFSTSANISSQPIPKSLNEVHEGILEQVDGVCIAKNESNEEMPSTIIDCSSDKISIIRKGAIGADILKIIED